MKQYTSKQSLGEVADRTLWTYLIELVEQVAGDAVNPGDDFQFMDVLGGDIFIVQSAEDLKQIRTATFQETGDVTQDTVVEESDGYLSIVETFDAFDCCEYILNGRYVNILLCTNNSGGDTYIVPRNIADKCDNIRRSIMATSTAWGDKEEKKPEAESSDWEEDVAEQETIVTLLGDDSASDEIDPLKR